MNEFPSSVAIVANSDTNIYRFRAPIARKLLEMGVIVYAIAPPGQYVASIEKMGVVFIPWSVDRRSLNPLSAVAEVFSLWGIYRRLKPDLAHHFTIKPNIYGAIASRLAGVPAVFGGVTGLGYTFSTTNPVSRFLSSYALLLYRLAANMSDCITFQTQQDIDTLFGANSLNGKARIISGGSGVELKTFNPDMVSDRQREMIREELGIRPGTLVVSMASRLLYDKGVSEYVKAARLVRSRRSDVCFILAGEPDPGNPGTVTAEDIQEWTSEGHIKYIGYRNDIQAIFAVSDVIAHPTYYREGVPRVLIEAAAMGRPIISTTTPGVSEILENGVNGISIPPRDAVELAAAIESLLADEEVRRRYGAVGRRMAEARFDDRKVADRHADEYRRVWTYAGARSGQAEARQRASAPSMTPPRPDQLDHHNISVIMPARDAEATISDALDSVISQDYPGHIEIIVADASDSPAMTGIIRASYPDVRVIPNPEHSIPAGLNHAIREATGEFIIRCDTSSKLPPTYVRRVVDVLKRTGASSVGGYQKVAGTTFFQKAVGLAMNSLLGSGGPIYRVGRIPGPADTVYLGAWRRDKLESVGGFNNHLLRNEDYELNWRLRQRGETVWFDPNLMVDYRPRSSLKELARQYFNYGRYKTAMLRIYPSSLQLRQLATPLLVLGLVASVVLGLMGLTWAAAPLPLLYLVILALGSAAIGVRHRNPAAILLPLVLATMHLSWGIGFFIPPRISTESQHDTPPPEN